MKKLGKYILTICFSALLLFGVVYSPTEFAVAEDDATIQELSTIYPNGISHYLYLNDMKDFCVVDDNIYYVTEGKLVDDQRIDHYYILNKYNLSTYEKQVFFDDSTTNESLRISNFKDIQYANGVIFVKNLDFIAYDSTSGERLNITRNSNFPSTSNSKFITISDLDDGMTVYSNIYIKDSNTYLGIAIFDSTENLLSGNAFAFDEYNLSTLGLAETDITKLVVSDNNAFVIKGSEIYPFSISLNNSTIELLSRDKKEVAKFADMRSIRAFNHSDKTYIAISTNNDITLYYRDISDTSTSNVSFVKNDSNNIIFVQGDKLYLYDSNECNIKTYSISESQNGLLSLSSDTTLLMGKGSDTGRFDGVNDIVMKCNEYIFVSDKANYRIQVLFSDGSVKVIDLKEESNSYYATSLMLSSDNTLYFVRTDTIQTSLCKINIFTENEPTVSKVCDLPNTICHSTMTNTGIIYLLNTANNSVQIYDSKTSEFKDPITLSYSINAFSKIGYMEDFLYISVDKSLYKIKPTNTAFNYEKSFNNDITDLYTSIPNNYVYVCFNDTNTIERVEFDNSKTPITTTFDEEYSISVLAVNSQDGTVYAYDSNASRIVYFYNKSFAKGYCDLESYQEGATTNSIGYENIVKYAKVPARNFIYEYADYNGKHSLYDEDKYVIVLDSSKSTTTYSYVLYTDGDSIKLGYVETNAIDIYEVYANQNYSLITSNYNTPIYKFPTIKGSIIVDTIPDISTQISASAIYPISIDNTNNSYYVVMTSDGRYGFVSSSCVTKNQNISQKFSANSTIKIYDYSESIKVYSDKNKTNIIGSLSNNQRIYVEKFDKNEEVTFIKYLDGENNIRTGYIETKYISTDGKSPVITTAIILFTINLILIIALLTWYIVFKKKQKKEVLKEQTKQIENNSENKSTKSKEEKSNPEETDNNSNNNN